jgi:hypothetical protein
LKLLKTYLCHDRIKQLYGSFSNALFPQNQDLNPKDLNVRGMSLLYSVQYLDPVLNVQSGRSLNQISSILWDILENESTLEHLNIRNLKEILEFYLENQENRKSIFQKLLSSFRSETSSKSALVPRIFQNEEVLHYVYKSMSQHLLDLSTVITENSFSWTLVYGLLDWLSTNPSHKTEFLMQLSTSSAFTAILLRETKENAQLIAFFNKVQSLDFNGLLKRQSSSFRVIMLEKYQTILESCTSLKELSESLGMLSLFLNSSSDVKVC